MSYFINAITQHYADFGGRARRKEFWMFQLFYLLSYFVAAVPCAILLAIAGVGGAPEGLVLGFLACSVGLFVPILAVTVRRLHDIGKSGWFVLVSFIPLVGGIWFLVLMCTGSQPGTNQYGPNPKGVGAATGSAAAPASFCAKCGSPRMIAAAFCAGCGNPA